MFGANIVLPFLAMFAGSFVGNWVGGPEGWIWGGAIGFGAGCAVLVLIWALFAILQRMVE
jgi:hypothetical protein